MFLNKGSFVNIGKKPGYCGLITGAWCLPCFLETYAWKTAYRLNARHFQLARGPASFSSVSGRYRWCLYVNRMWWTEKILLWNKYI